MDSESRGLQGCSRTKPLGVITVEQETTESVQQAAKVLSILKHVKENNVSYLLGMFVLHSMGILEQAFTYGQGMC